MGKPVHEEEWEFHQRGPDGSGCARIYSSEGDADEWAWTGKDTVDMARARLASAAPDMARVLMALGSQELTGTGCLFCCYCNEDDDAGGHAIRHAPDCALDLALRKAGVR